jgi:hypothetical protein
MIILRDLGAAIQQADGGIVRVVIIDDLPVGYSRINRMGNMAYPFDLAMSLSIKGGVFITC